MAKVVNFEDKLAFDENPKIQINGKEYELNADAETVLKVMGAVGSGNTGKMMQAMYMIFHDKDLEEISKIQENGKKLSAKAMMDIMNAAIDVIMGEDEAGEQ